MPKIVLATENRLQVEVRRLLFRFVGDMEMILDLEQKLIHIRSASRLGYSDLGVNRRRVEALRKQLQQADLLE